MCQKCGWERVVITFSQKEKKGEISCECGSQEVAPEVLAEVWRALHPTPPQPMPRLVGEPMSW